MYAISIDSGGTKVVGALVDEKGSILSKIRFDVLKRDGDFLLETFRKIIKHYRSNYSVDVVGIGGNGRINPEEGIVLSCGVHANWEGRNIKKELQDVCGPLPISFNNDCHCAIKGEMWMGSACDYDIVVGMIIGTGLGGGLLSHGKFWNGREYGAGEIGHTLLHPGGLDCYCGQRGCAERYVSGTALWKNYNKAVGEERIKSGYEFFQRCREGDPIAQQVLRTFVGDLTILLVNVANLCAPEAILIGGGIADTKDLWSDMLQQQFDREAGDWIKKTQIIYASKGNDASLLGAAKFAFELLQRNNAM